MPDLSLVTWLPFVLPRALAAARDLGTESYPPAGVAAYAWPVLAERYEQLVEEACASARAIA